MSTMLVAKHYGETETRISKDTRTCTLFFEYLFQGGTMENLSNDMLTINKEAYKRGIEAAHIGAVVGAFEIIYKELQNTKRLLLNTTEEEGFTTEEVAKLKGMAEKGVYKFIKV